MNNLILVITIQLVFVAAMLIQIARNQVILGRHIMRTNELLTIITNENQKQTIMTKHYLRQGRVK